MRNPTMCLAAALGAAAAFGGVEVTAWRGETVNVLLDEGLGSRVQGLGFGAVDPKPYTLDPHEVNGVAQSLAPLMPAPSSSLLPTVRVGAVRDASFVLTPKDEATRTNAPDRVVWLTDAPRPDGLSTGVDAPRLAQVRVPAGTAPGVYDLGVVTVRVLDRVLTPVRERPYYLDLWQHPWAVARWRGVEPFSQAHYDAMKPLWEGLAALGQRTITVTLLDLPWNHQCYDGYGTMVRHIRRADGSWAFDYSVFDAYVAFALACGLGPDIACYTLCPWGYRVTWEDEAGATHRAEAKPGSALFADYWGPFLADFAAHLKAKGWFGRTLIAMDERGPDDVRLIADFVQEKAPGLRVAMAGNRNPGDFKGIRLDVYSQCLEHVSPQYIAEAAARRAQGFTTTYYVCCSPRTPNTFAFSDPSEAFFLAFAAEAAGLDGLLRWAYNSWPLDPYADASYGNWASGDTFLVYPDGAPSRRLLMLQNGLEAAEKLRLLRAEGTRREELDALAARFDPKAAEGRGGAFFRERMAEANAALNRE